MAKKPKRIYIAKRNHSVFASASTVSEMYLNVIKNSIQGEGSEIPSLPTFIRRLRLYQELKFDTSLKNHYEVIEMKNERYNRQKM